MPPGVGTLTVTVELALLACREGRLAVLLAATGGRAELPSRALGRGDDPRQVAARLAASLTGARVPWLSLVSATARARGARLSAAGIAVGFAAVSPRAEHATSHGAWTSIEALPVLAPRQRALVDGARATVRRALDASPVAFGLLPPDFTLAELQETYELVLRRRLHKASFRRTLAGASLIAATGTWRHDRRGRPAQLFRYAPRQRRAAPPAVRFDGIRDESYQVETKR
jgi:hypothetical protein